MTRTFPAITALAIVALIPGLSGDANAGGLGALPGGTIVAQQKHLSAPPRPVVRLPPGSLLPRRSYQHRTPFIPSRLHHICKGPDLALEAIRIVFSQVYNPREPFNPNQSRYHVDYSIEAVVKNIGRRDWKSGANQQQVNLDFRRPGRPLRYSDRNHFPLFLRAGGSGTVFLAGPFEVGWSRAFVPPPYTYHAYLAYDPDIYNDGNPANDDCNAHNQSITVSSRQLGQAILSRKTVVDFHR